MKNRILVLTLATVVGFISCGKDKELIEVTIPEPEKVEKVAVGKYKFRLRKFEILVFRIADDSVFALLL